MSDSGVTDTGFITKRFDQLLDESNAATKSIFGDNFNVSPESPDGQINGVISESNANLWEGLEAAYNAGNPNAALLVALDNLSALNGVTRLSATGSRAQLTLTGTSSTVIPVGSLVSTNDTQVTFVTETEVTLDGGGGGTVFATANVTGPVIALATTITVIDTPITGWTSVTNALDAILGTNQETDPTLRARRAQSTANPSQSVVDSIFSSVSNISGVTATTVLENDTDATDGNGQPEHSIQAVVVGGVDLDIATAIFLTKPTGITAFGTTTEAVLDSQNISHDISFSRPTEIDIFVEVTLTTDSGYPGDGDDLIKQAIVDYANGVLVDGRGFPLGQDVIFSRLYTPINSVPGHSIDSLFIDTSPSPSATDDIAIAATEISNFTIANITVL